MTAPVTMATYALGLIISKLIGLLLQPWVTQWLGIHEYGQLDVLVILVTSLSIILTFGLPDAISRFAHNKEINQVDLIAGALWLMICISGITTILLWMNVGTLQQWLPGEPSLFSLRCLLFNLFLNTLCTVPLTKLRLENKAPKFVMALLTFSLSQALLILLLTPRLGIDGIMIAGVIAQLIQFLSLITSFPAPRQQHFRLLLRYGGAITTAGILAFITLGAERWAIAEVLNLNELATYAIAMQWAIAASLLLEPFGLWWFPQRFRFIDTENEQRYAALMGVTACQLSSVITACVITIGPSFLTLWLPEEFHKSANILPILAVMMMFKHASTYLNMGCYQQENGKSVLQINVISALAALVIIFGVLPNWGLPALLAGGVYLQLLRLSLFYIWSQRLLPLPYPHGRLVICYLFVLSLTIAHFISHPTLKYIITISLIIYCLWSWRDKSRYHTKMLRRL
ncbi:lipopolysaccharide biosynthesis protein [Photobacterium sanguinicancri]|uniref:Polysaccharide biosynthesis family protein n=1 Tax=Photobacterium sanguinicancri TaxID=875932 RepID=A0ABX4FZT5_9GAMM|nr:oligosaccharide flippase family protein [Photobacterium sanguinicancri]OZS44423.1 polysaccharide biosynthesis family protein [Photobacterium sanguinicancri]